MREQLPLTNIQPNACPPKHPHVYFLCYDGDAYLRQQSRLYMGGMQLLYGWSGPKPRGKAAAKRAWLCTDQYLPVVGRGGFSRYRLCVREVV